MALWMVRAGRRGEREPIALDAAIPATAPDNLRIASRTNELTSKESRNDESK